jgi:hypothetical protein
LLPTAKRNGPSGPFLISGIAVDDAGYQATELFAIKLGFKPHWRAATSPCGRAALRLRAAISSRARIVEVNQLRDCESWKLDVGSGTKIPAQIHLVE